MNWDNLEKKYDDLIEEIKELLEERKQVILNGAPGTGKTHTAYEVAKMIVLGKEERVDENNLSEGDKKRICQVQFHPGYDYSDFIVGLKPVLLDKDGKEVDKANGGEGVTLSYRWKSGVFKEFADKARAGVEKGDGKYVLIIDEINRADLSNVFGEAFSLIEKDYRWGKDNNGNEIGKKITLPGSVESQDGEGDQKKNENVSDFMIPRNLYIIGTMNDIDRSVESMDFALRRRFAWREISAEDSAVIVSEKLKGAPEQLIKALIDDGEFTKTDSTNTEGAEDKEDDKNKGNSFMEAINLLIAKHLGSEYQLGGAYFVSDEFKDEPEKYFDNLWNHHIEVILKDYLRGNKKKDYLMEDFRNLYEEYKKQAVAK